MVDRGSFPLDRPTSVPVNQGVCQRLDAGFGGFPGKSAATVAYCLEWTVALLLRAGTGRGDRASLQPRRSTQPGAF